MVSLAPGPVLPHRKCSISGCGIKKQRSIVRGQGLASCGVTRANGGAVTVPRRGRGIFPLSLPGKSRQRDRRKEMPREQMQGF